jgi:hypothetical protein
MVLMNKIYKYLSPFENINYCLNVKAQYSTIYSPMNTDGPQYLFVCL